MLRELNVVEQRYRAVPVGPRRLVFELAKRGHLDISRSTVYRVLVRRQLIKPVPRRRRRDQYRRWERSAAMELWRLDVTVEANTYQVGVEPGIVIAPARTTSCDIRRHKASNYD
jgi:hypothetical protein